MIFQLSYLINCFPPLAVQDFLKDKVFCTNCFLLSARILFFRCRNVFWSLCMIFLFYFPLHEFFFGIPPPPTPRPHDNSSNGPSQTVTKCKYASIITSISNILLKYIIHPRNPPGEVLPYKMIHLLVIPFRGHNLSNVLKPLTVLKSKMTHR